MKYSPRRFRYVMAGMGALLVAVATRADHPEWIRFIEAGSRIEQAFFKPYNLPAGTVSLRRPPKEARAELTTLINATPSQAELYSYRAREEELLLDFNAAESDWKKYAELAADKAEGNTALANYYHRQLKVQEELKALSAAAAPASPASERFTPAAQQTSWKTFERMLALCRNQLLDHAAVRDVYQQWTARYPQESAVLENWVRAEIAAKQYDRAEALIAEHGKRFPQDASYPAATRAELERARGRMTEALAIYERSFEPLWPANLMQGYFGLLRETRTLRRFAADARDAAQKDPNAFLPAVRLFHYYQQEGNPAAAQRVLSDLRRRREARPNAWNANELLTLAKLWENYANDRNEAARFYYALYSLPGASAEQREEALASIAFMMLSAPDQKMALGGGDLSFYRDIASADAYPGFLNGILSLLLNSADPAFRFAGQEQAATPYFMRTRAAELVALFERQFAQSTWRPILRSKLIEAYALHGDSDAVLTSGRRFLSDFPQHSSRETVSLAMADAHARKNQVKEELALYDALLGELAKNAGGVPLGEGVVTNPGQQGGMRGPRSASYARVLDRYVSRLAAMKRVKDALIVLRRELDRNPNDPGLYERLAGFLDQNKLAAEMEAVYKKAIEQFPDRNWYHKLARYYLRQKQSAQFQALTGDIAKVFSGTELERYFREVVATQTLDAALYRQVNLYAHQRFPQNLRFVQNLLEVYQRKGTADPVAYENLLRRYWAYDDGMRSRFFEVLQRTGKFRTEVQALPAQASQNPAAARMLAEAEAWRSHFEDAATTMLVLAKDSPGDPALGQRTASLYRSLAAYDSQKAQESAAVEANLIKASPRDFDPRTRLGELNREYARVTAGRDAWNAIPDIQPGSADGYLEAATVHWDYFEYDAALKQLENGRRKLNNDALFAYEAGAIYENKRQYDRAIEEYVKGSLAQPGGSPAQTRLLALARRPAYRSAIDAATAKLGSGASPTLPAVALRIALLEAHERKSDLEAYLLGLAAQTQSFELLGRMEEEGRRLAFANVEERAVARQIELTPEPLDKLQLRLKLAHFYENHRNQPAAARTIDAMVRENPMTLGVMRGAVNYYWRNKNGPRAVELLTAAANAAHSSLKPTLQFEAARKATESGQYAAARNLIQPLLQSEPYNASYLAAMADTYAREGNDQALGAFYREKISAFATAPLPPVERMERVAAMRRSLIPVLTRAKDTASAVDQYIEIINRYPEDTALLEEAAAYARKHQQQQRLTSYYEKTAAASPRDFRWPLVLARVYTSFEDYPAAIAMYTKVGEIRPDRSDIFIARGTMEERLLRFDEAAATFNKVYELTYRNSTWMERIAEIRARQGRTADVVAALRTAYLEGRNDSAQPNFDVAERLDRWGMTQEAAPFAERAVTLAGAVLLNDYMEGAQTYARILTKQKRYAVAHAKAPKGQLLMAMAGVVRASFNAQDKAQFAAFLDKIKPVTTPDVARVAGLAAWEARRTQELLLANANGEGAQEYLERLKQLQRNRLAFGELGTQLEAYATAIKDLDARPPVLAMSADSFQQAGDEPAELRVRTKIGGGETRYLTLLARRNPKALIARAEFDAINAALDDNKADLVMQVIAAKGVSMPPVWTRAYTGLAGLYFALTTPEVNAAFQEALGPMIVGERVGKPLDTRETITGNLWYYYGARYGEYLDVQKNALAGDLLPAMVEGTPGNAAAYFRLGEYYRQSNRSAEAIAEYENALQLDAKHAAALDRIARIQWAGNQREEAKSRWRQALDALREQLEQRRQPASLSGDLRDVLDQLASRQLLTEFRPQLEAVVTSFVRRYGAYDAQAILRHFDTGWMVAVSRNTPNPVDFLMALVEAEWIPTAQKEPLYERILEVLNAQASSAVGDARDQALAGYYGWQSRWVEYLLDRKLAARAQSVVSSWNEETRQRLGYSLPAIEMRIAAQTGRLEALLTEYALDASRLSNPYQAREVSMKLRENGDNASARKLLRFFYDRQIAAGDLSIANFLGLAEVLLEEDNTTEAVRQLKRMALVTQPAFAGLKDAGLLLRRFKKDAEASQFLEDAVKAVPWDASAKEALNAAAAPAPARTLAQLEADVRSDPVEPALKLALFRAARAAGRHRLATNAIEVMHGNSLGPLFVREEVMSAEPHFNSYWAESFLSMVNLTNGERARIAREVSDSLARTERPQGALVAMQIAEKLEPSAQNRTRITALRAELRRQLTNRERRPVVGETLDQEKIVRPMIAAAGGAR